MASNSGLHQPWAPRPGADALFASALAIAEFALRTETLLAAHRDELLSTAIWKWTERDGKWRTRFRSSGALSLGPGWHKHVNHEHVTPRLALRRAMLQDPHRVGEILRSAQACVVTREEHGRLNAIGEEFRGWERYRAAQVDVYDMATGLLMISNDDVGGVTAQP